MINDFGSNLKIERERNKISQQKLAKMLDIDRSLISYWESGACEPSFDALCKLRIIFDISTDELLGIDKIEKEKEFRKNINFDI